MIDQHQPEDLNEKNESSLQMLVAAIELEGFSLIFGRCNYASLRDRMVKRLQEICPVDIRVIALKESVKTLYTTIKNELGNEKPAALIVFDLELVSALDQVLISSNQVRDEFGKNFSFPVVLWINDEVLKKLSNLAPDFKGWGISCEFAMTTDDLVTLLQKEANLIFSGTLEAGDQFVPNCVLLDSCYRLELDSARKDLQSRAQQLEPELEASLQFILGRDEYANDQIDAALDLYHQSLEFWQQSNNFERQGVLLFHIGLCYCRKADLQRSQNHLYWKEARNYFQQCLDIFEQAQRSDLVAKFIGQLGRVLQNLQAWEDLRELAHKAQGLHETLGSPVQLAQDYGFLAEVALEKYRVSKSDECAKEAGKLAQRALQILAKAPENQQHQGLYLLLLAQSQRYLSQQSKAIANLEKARKISVPPQSDPQLYIRILSELRSLYFDQQQYLTAFEIKQEQRLIEQQHRFRAFIGAGRLQLQEQAGRQEETVFDRQQDVERLLKEGIIPQDRKLTVIHGPSGVGKSSIIDAGLVPVLKQKNIGERTALPIVLRVYTDWSGALGKALVDALALKEIIDSELPAPNSVAEIIAQLQENAQRNLLTVLIFDQFEEFFFVDIERDKRQQFYDLLKKCLNGREVQFVKVILSLREDYLHCLLKYERFINLNRIDTDLDLDTLSKKSRHYIGDFTRDDATLVIQNSTKRSQFDLESELIDELVRDLAGKVGEVRPIELQVVGAQLQEDKITTLEQYRGLGDNPKAELIERYLAEVIKDCGEKNQEIAQQLLYLLTDENNTRPLKTRAELAASLELKANNLDLDLVLKILVGSGLVLRLPESPADRYQLVHDYLVAFIRQRWQTELIETKEKLKHAAQATQLLIEAQQQAMRKISIGSIIVILFFVGAAAIAGVLASKAFLKLEEAKKATKIERTGLSALRQFDSREIEALLSAMKSGKELNNLVKDGRSLQDYPAISPLLALQTILDSIHEQNQFSVPQSEVDEVYDVSFSPDGKIVATVEKNGTVRLWNRAGKQLRRLWQGHKGEVDSVTFSRDGQRLATAGADGTARLWNLSGKQLALLKGHRQKVTSVDFSPNGWVVATAGEDGTVRLWSLSGQQLVEWPGQHGKVWSVSFSPDGKSLATAGEDGTTRLWNLSGQQLAPPLKGHQGAVFSVSFSLDGQLLATAGYDGTVRLWDLLGKPRGLFKTNQAVVTSVNFSPVDKQRIATTAADGTVRLWKLSKQSKKAADGNYRWELDGKLLTQFKGHSERVYGASFSRDGRYLATAGGDGTTRLWNLLGQQRLEWEAHEGASWSVSFSPDGKSLATAGLKDSTVRLWNLSGKKQIEWKTYQTKIESISFSPKGEYVATAGDNGTVLLWNLSGQQIAPPLKGYQGKVYSVNFSPDGQYIATAGENGKAILWNLSGQQIAQLTGHQKTIFKVFKVNFSPDGQRLTTAGEDGKVRLWNLSGEEIGQFNSHQSEVYSVSFSRDGQHLATAGTDGTARLWNLSGQQIAQFDGHQGKVYSVNFSRDGQRLATAGADGTVRLWFLPDQQSEQQSGQQIAQFDRHQDGAYSTSFSPDGQRFATVGEDGMVRLWKVEEELDELLVRGCDWLKEYLETHPQPSKICPSK